MLIFFLIVAISHILFWVSYYQIYLRDQALSLPELQMLLASGFFAFLFGSLYQVMKIFIASKIAIDFRKIMLPKRKFARKQLWRVRILVDELTNLLHQDFANFN